MAHTTESDGTYCSEVEKDQDQISRSKLLSQRNLLSRFRSNADLIQRLCEIYQTLKCSNWSINEWKSFQFEVESIEQAIKGQQKGRTSFILKQINKNLQKSDTICPNESPTTIQPDQTYEQVKSPNILAGMLTEDFTENPPYQLENLPEVKGTVKNSEPTITLTQKNPLDLTKKNFVNQVMPDEVISQDFFERKNQKQAKTRTLIKAVTTAEQRDKVKAATATTTLNISKESIIDLTEENVSETNGENVMKQKSKSLENSIEKLHSDQPTATTSISNSIQKPLTSSCPRVLKHVRKLDFSSIRSESNANKAFQNTDNIITRDANLTRVFPCNAQSENFGNIFGNIVPVMKERTVRPKTPVDVSKWFQFLSSQQRPTKRANVTTTTTTSKKKSKSLENSFEKLHSDQPTATTSISNSIQKPLTTSCPRELKHVRKLDFSSIRSESNANKPFQNKENIITRDANLTRVFPSNVQSENFGNIFGNIVPVMKERTVRPKTSVDVSKWLQFLPTQQRPTKRANVTTTTTTSGKKSKSLENSVVKLHSDQPTATTSISNSIQKPLTTSCPRELKHVRQLDFSSIRSESNANKPFQNKENIITRDANLTRVFPSNAQSDNFGNIFGNIVPVMKERTVRPKTPVDVSKWLQFLPTQQRPTKRANVTTTTTTSGKKSKSLENSIVKLHSDQPTATTSISNSIQKPLTTSCPRELKHVRNLDFSSIRSESNANKPFQNTENIITRDENLTRVFPCNAQSNHFGNISPGFLLEKVFESDMNDKENSLTPSLKEGFRKVFGTDKLKDIFVGDEVVCCVKENHVVDDEVVYCLKENHVRCLARALTVEHGILKETIENILSNDNYGLFQDDIMQSDSSVVECSQSPPHRIFPSQRSKK